MGRRNCSAAKGRRWCMRPTIGYSWTTMRNIDRHYNNLGLIRDVETCGSGPRRCSTPEPLWCGELAIDNRDYKAKPFYATYKTPTARRQLRLISDWARYDLGKLDGWEEQVGHRLSVTGLVPETRITAIATMLSARIREVRSLAESAGDDSNHKTVVMGAETGIGTGMLPWPSPMEQGGNGESPLAVHDKRPDIVLEQRVHALAGDIAAFRGAAGNHHPPAITVLRRSHNPSSKPRRSPCRIFPGRGPRRTPIHRLATTCQPGWAFSHDARPGPLRFTVPIGRASSTTASSPRRGNARETLPQPSHHRT